METSSTTFNTGHLSRLLSDTVIGVITNTATWGIFYAMSINSGSQSNALTPTQLAGLSLVMGFLLLLWVHIASRTNNNIGPQLSRIEEELIRVRTLVSVLLNQRQFLVPDGLGPKSQKNASIVGATGGALMGAGIGLFFLANAGFGLSPGFTAGLPFSIAGAVVGDYSAKLGVGEYRPKEIDVEKVEQNTRGKVLSTLEEGDRFSESRPQAIKTVIQEEISRLERDIWEAISEEIQSQMENVKPRMTEDELRAISFQELGSSMRELGVTENQSEIIGRLDELVSKVQSIEETSSSDQYTQTLVERIEEMQHELEMIRRDLDYLQSEVGASFTRPRGVPTADYADSALAGEVSSDVAQVPDAARELLKIGGIGPARAMALHEAGYSTIDDLRQASVEDLIEVNQIGQITAERIVNSVREIE